jgi:tetratricopeptide (TPR) repeat protein
MLSIALDTHNYRQLVKTDPELAEDLESVIAHLFTDLSEESLRMTAELLFRLRDEMRNREERLFGYSILVLVDEGDESGSTTREARRCLLQIEVENCIWLNSRARTFFKDTLEVEESLPLAKVVSVRDVPVPKGQFEQRSYVCLRPRIVEMIVRRIASRPRSPQLSAASPAGKKIPGAETNEISEVDSQAIVVVGPPNIGKKAAVAEAARRLSMPSSAIDRDKKPGTLPARLFTIFKRQSPIHPFLNSIDTDMADQAPQFLNKVELRLWKEKSSLIYYLKNQKKSSRCYDHISEDFYTLYALYLVAYVRKRESEGLPALLICEGLETYHPECFKALALLLNDFIRLPSFVPILITAEEKNLSELSKLPMDMLRVFPSGWKEVREMAGSCYPGVLLKRSVARSIVDLSRGNIRLIWYYLLFLGRSGKITAGDNGYVWRSREEKDIAFPESEDALEWDMLRSLDQTSREILYAICLSSGLIGEKDLSTFLENMGIDASSDAFQNLSNAGLVTHHDILIPESSRLKKKLDALVGERAGFIKAAFIDYLVKRWQDDAYPHLILLLYFLSKNDRSDIASQIVPVVVKRKLDERDLAGVKPFFQTRRLGFLRELSEEDGARLNQALTCSRLRFSLISGDLAEAEKAMENLAKELQPYPSYEKGNALLAMSSYYVTKADVGKAIEKAKESLIIFQDIEEGEAEAAAYLELGTGMLASGKIEEALEYLDLSEKKLDHASFEKLRCSAFSAIALFIQGNLAKLNTIIQNAYEMADGLGRREWQLYLSFFKGRIAFHMGSYVDAGLIMQDCLALASVYSFEEARTVLYAWLARALIYQGRPKEAANILREIRSTAEKHYFMAEACYFEGDYSDALDQLEKGLKKSQPLVPYPGENIYWANGFASLEGRCIASEEREPLITRLMLSFKAHLLALSGNMTESEELFRAIIRRKQLPALDVHFSLYYYNQAVKSLQERASRIESPKERALFVGRNAWNKRIMADARQRRLV